MRLRKMTPQEYAAFREFSVADYGREIAAAGRLSMDAARAQAQREFDDQLTQGENTPCNHVCIIDQAGEAQGFIWYQLAEAQAGVKYVFLCDFYVAEPHRRKGVATAALHCMEQSARAQDCTEARLYVWAHNQPARRLYEKCGYAPAKTEADGKYMKKLL